MSPAEIENLPCVQFKNELVSAITEQSGVDIFVLDFRENRGGWFFEGIDRLFVWTQAEENRDLLGSVYVVIDSFTYSFGTLHASLFKAYIDDAVMIGSPASGALNFFGAGEGWTEPLVLPNSQISFRLGGGAFWNLDPYTETNTLYPDIFVYRTAEDFMNNHDAVIEAIRQRHN